MLIELSAKIGRIFLDNNLCRQLVMPSEICCTHKLSDALKSIQNRWPEICEDNDENESPVFIFSAGWGSGSTLMQRLVLSSGEVVIWGEPLDHTIQIPRLAWVIACIGQNYPPDKFFFNADINLSELSGEWVANLTPSLSYLKRSHKMLIKEWLGKPSTRFGVSRWGLKEVRFTIDHARYLKWLFPKAKFIFLYRNLYSCYKSIKGRRWFSVWPKYRMSRVTYFAHHWKYLLEGFLEGYQEVDGILIKYEDLVSGKFNLDRITEYIKVDHIDKGVMEKKIRERGPKNKLSLREQLILKSIGGRLLERLGYL